MLTLYLPALDLKKAFLQEALFSFVLSLVRPVIRDIMFVTGVHYHWNDIFKAILVNEQDCIY